MATIVRTGASTPDTPLATSLRYGDDTAPGIRRRRTATGFRYIDAADKPLRDPHALARIRALAIPPAYTDVWISPDPATHLQATGRDARGRKQYRYHPHWREERCRVSASAPTPICACPACRARRSWPPSSNCSIAPSSGSAIASTPSPTTRSA